MKTGLTIEQLVEKLEWQNSFKADYLVPSQHLKLNSTTNGLCRLAMELDTGKRDFDMARLARNQLAERLGIPYSYFETMRETKPDLLDTNVNTWLQMPANVPRLLRTLDGKVRAVLSDHYRIFDNYGLAKYVLPMLAEMPGATLVSSEVTDTKFYLKVVSDRYTEEIGVGDVVQVGVIITNSEVGCGRLTVDPILFRLACKNGMVCEDMGWGRQHVGRRNSCEADFFKQFRSDTIEAEDKLFFLKVRDMVQEHVSALTLRKMSDRLRKTKGISLQGDPAEAVHQLGRKFEMTKEEKAGVLRELILGGNLDGFGMVNAVTAYSQQVEDYDRSSELDAIGGRMMAMSEKEWQLIATAT